MESNLKVVSQARSENNIFDNYWNMKNYVYVKYTNICLQLAEYFTAGTNLLFGDSVEL